MPLDDGKRKRGYVKAWRCTLEWWGFTNPRLAHFWEYCRLKASRQARDVLFNGEKIHLEPGQFVFGRNVAAAETGLSPQQIRTCLKHLSAGTSPETTIRSTKRYSVVTLVNWNGYQVKGDESNQDINHDPTMSQPCPNHRQEC